MMMDERGALQQLSRRHCLAALALLGVGCGRSGGESIAKLRRGVMALAASGDRLLWVTGPDDGALFMVPLSGADPRPLLEGLSWARHLAGAGEEVWLACSDRVLRVPLVGTGAVSTPVEHAALRVAPLGQTDPSAAFWIEADGSLHFMQQGKRARLYQAAPWPSALVVHETSAYWAAGQPSVLYRTEVAGSTRALHVPGIVSDIAVAGQRLLYTTGEALCARPASGGEQTVLCGGLHAPSALVVHRERAFFIDGPAQPGGASRLMQLPLSEGAAASVVGELQAAQGLAFAGGQLFSASASERKLRRFTLG